MRFVLAALLSTFLLAASEPQAKKKTPAPAVKAPKPLTIPAGAVEREPGRFYFTDSNGKKWIYMKTPFGVARAEDKPSADTAKPAETLAGVKVTEEGDIVKFERQSPFGVYKWQKNKNDLDEKEQAALLNARKIASKQDN